jgi:tight adherence protein B
METVLLIGIVVLACAVPLVLVPGAAGDSSIPLPLVMERWQMLLRRRALFALGRLGSTRLVAWLLGHQSWRSCAARLARAPRVLALGLDVRSCCAAVVVAQALAAALAGVLMGSVSCALVAWIALLAAVPALDTRARTAARKQAASEMPGVFRTLAVAMGAGQTLAQAVSYVGSHAKGAVGESFSRLALRMRCGMAAEDALDVLAHELDAPGVGLLSTALVVSHRTGSPLRSLFQRSAKLVERQGEFERMLTVKTAQVRLSVRIVCLLPAILVGVLTLISPDFQRGLLTASGLACVGVAALLDGLAVLIVRRLARGVL